MVPHTGGEERDVYATLWHLRRLKRGGAYCIQRYTKKREAVTTGTDFYWLHVKSSTLYLNKYIYYTLTALPVDLHSLQYYCRPNPQCSCKKAREKKKDNYKHVKVAHNDTEY